MERYTIQQRVEIVKRQRIPILVKKSSSATRHTFGWTASLTSKIAAFGARAIHINIKRAYCIRRNSLSGVGFGQAASLGHTSSATKEVRGDCEWCTIQINDNKFFLAQIGRYGLGKHVVPTRRCDKPHSCRKSWVVAREVPGTGYFEKSRCRMATKIMRFNTLRLFSLGLC